MKPSRAFTLIELLIVVAIIAMLAAILFPVFSSAREKARQTSCASNLRQLGLGFMQYSQDYDETFPFNAVAVNGTWVGWDLLISPYAGLNATFLESSTGEPRSPFYNCPDDWLPRYNNNSSSEQATPRTYVEAAEVNDGGFAHACYASASCSYPVGGGNLFPGRSVAEFPSPSGTFMLVEQPNVNNLLGTSDDAWSFGPYNAFEPGGGINVNWRTQDCAGTTNPINGTCSSAASLGSPLHSGGWNYLYVDGHVKWLFPSNTFGTPGRQPVGHTLNPNTTGWCNATAQSPCGPWTLDENDN